MPLFSPADFSEEIQGHGGGPPHHQGDHLPASGGNPYITSNEPYFPGHYLGAHKSPCKFSSPGAVCSHCIRSPAGFGGPSQACQLPFDPMQAANAGLQSTGTNGDMGPQDRIRGSALSGSRTTHCAPDCSQSLWHSRSRGVDPQGWLVTVVDPGCATFHSRVCLCTLNLSFLMCILVLRSSINGCTSGQVYQ